LQLLLGHGLVLALELLGAVLLVGDVLDAFTCLEQRSDDFHEGAVAQMEGARTVGADAVVVGVHAGVLHGVQYVHNGLHALPCGPLDAIFGNVDNLLVRVGLGLTLDALDVHHRVHVVLDDAVAFAEGEELHVVLVQQPLGDFVLVSLHRLQVGLCEANVYWNYAHVGSYNFIV